MSFGKIVSSDTGSGGLASLLQGLMKKDRKQLDSRSQSTGSLMQSLGWGSDQPDGALDYLLLIKLFFS